MLPLNYLLFLQIIIFLFITPGTPRMVIISYSMNYGVQKCIWTALGDISANFIQAILVIFFIGTFFSDYPEFLNTIKWLGVAYLLYLARNFLIMFKGLLPALGGSETKRVVLDATKTTVMLMFIIANALDICSRISIRTYTSNHYRMDAKFRF